MEKVALLGIGTMGLGMGHILLQAGYPLTVYNRTRAKAEPLAEAGAILAANPREAVADADVIISMVADDTASRAMWLGDDGALAGAKPDAVLIESSTLTVTWVHKLAGNAAEKGLAFLDSPVTGSRDAAASGQLMLLIGGDEAVIGRVEPILRAISRDMIHFGPVGSGATAKLVHNLVLALQSIGLAEGLGLAAQSNLPLDKVHAMLSKGSTGSPLVQKRGPRMIEHNYSDPDFQLRHMRKDVTYALQLANEVGAAMPLLAVGRELYQLAGRLGYDESEMSAVSEVLRVKS